MAEWSIAAVLKTVEGHTSGGSNPSLSAKEKAMRSVAFFVCWNQVTACGHKDEGIQKEKACETMPFASRDARGSVGIK